MGAPTPPQPVKLLVALLSADPTLFATAAVRLQHSYGAVDLESDIFPWNTTDYYREEMGEQHQRGNRTVIWITRLTRHFKEGLYYYCGLCGRMRHISHFPH